MARLGELIFGKRGVTAGCLSDKRRLENAPTKLCDGSCWCWEDKRGSS